MRSLLLLALSLCLTSTQRSLVSCKLLLEDDRQQQEELTSEIVQHNTATESTTTERATESSPRVIYAIKNVTLWHERLINRVNTSHQHHVRYDQDCNLKITQAPGSISYRFDVSPRTRKIKPCRWTIRAPEGRHVYVRFFHVESYTDRPAGYDERGELLPLRIFDSNTVDHERLLFRFGDATLNNALSRGRDITIDVAEHYFGTVDYHLMSLLFGFVDDEEVADLLRIGRIER